VKIPAIWIRVGADQCSFSSGMGQKLVVTGGHMDLLSSVVGYSRWTLADLHVHTPVDFNHHYGDVGGPQPNAAFATTLIKAHADAGVTVMAVTDHNTIS
jgi:hypothetical protein